MLNRRVVPVIVAAAFALTACGSPTATPSASPSGTVAPSATPSASATTAAQTNLDAIKVTGKRLKTPKVTFKAPLVIDQTRSKVLSPGKGGTVLESGLVTVHYYGVNGRTGKVFDQSYARKASITFPLAGVVAGFRVGLTGQKVGSRVLIAMPGSDAYDANGGMSDAGIEVGDTLIFVVDIVGASLSQPSGKVVPPSAGSPSVTGAAADKPTVTMPGNAAPAKMSAQSLIEGGGVKVGKSDLIYVRYVGYSWKTGRLIDDQWTPSEGELASTISGWQKGLVGKKVGSRVLLVLPPADGYPQGSNNPPLEAGDTIVYVIDILYTYQA